MNIHRVTNATLLAAALLLSGLVTPVWSEPTGENWEKVVFHVDETANARWAILLANSYLDDRPGAKIVFVSYGPGVDFLLKGAEDRRGNRFSAPLANLADQGVEFRVCAATLGARQIAKEELLDLAIIVPSGISEIARLQLREGYAYLKP